MIKLLLAFLLDLWIGDPVYAWHPVRIMGKAIEWSERILRNIIKNNYISGIFLAVIFPLVVFVTVYFTIYICFKIHPWLALTVNLLGIYTAISIHDLRKEAIQIHSDLQNKDLILARRDLARIVGRDTNNLDEKGITRATIETVAESTVDGVVSPLFYAALGGAPLALAYKAINTLDSIVGHKNDRYKEFGCFSAKIDDVLNWIPARLSYGFICIATLFTRFDLKSALIAGGREVKHFNNISNLPEATFAGALQVQLGGVNSYHGRLEKKTLLGVEERSIKPNLIPESLKLMVCSSWVALIFCLTINYFIVRI